ncbi:MAG TPA: hypothetical protein VGH48_13350 [Caldimonas sp.]
MAGAAAGTCGFAACDLPLVGGLGAGVGNLAGAAFVGTGLFVTGAAARPFAGAAFLDGAAFWAGFLAGDGFFVATGFLAAAGFFTAGFFFATTALPLAGAVRCGAGFAVGRACEVFAAGFFAVFLTAGFFTGSPRNGIASLARERRCEGGAVFDRRGL